MWLRATLLDSTDSEGRVHRLQLPCRERGVLVGVKEEELSVISKFLSAERGQVVILLVSGTALGVSSCFYMKVSAHGPAPGLL